jgi:hypothetical protein
VILNIIVYGTIKVYRRNCFDPGIHINLSHIVPGEPIVHVKGIIPLVFQVKARIENIKSAPIRVELRIPVG